MKQGQRPDAQRRRSEHRSDWPVLSCHPDEQSDSQFSAVADSNCLHRHDTRSVRANASILPACLQRLQAVERNVAKQRANGAVHLPLRRGVKCSRLQTDGVRHAPAGSLRMSVRSHAPEQTRSAVCRRFVRCAAGASEALAASSMSQRSEVGVCAVLAQRCLCLSRD